MPVRLQKFLAEAGVASRRAGEKLILAGRVAVNGATVLRLGTKVDPDEDRVTLDGVPLKAKRKFYVALHKPAGYLCARHDPTDRRLIGELLPREWGNLYSVGRLDWASEGLLLLTNDGEFCLRLTHPRHGLRKKYLVTVEGLVGLSRVKRLEHGVHHEGERLQAASARLLTAKPAYSLVEVVLTEGKNRELRRMLQSLGLVVTQLKRTQIGPVKLGELPSGKWRVLREAEVRSLLEASSPARAPRPALRPG